MKRIAASFSATMIVMFARFITAVRGVWRGAEPTQRQRVYFANHASNGDFVLVWAVLPPRLRARTRPVAAADYWLSSRLREFIGRNVFDAVLIDRKRTEGAQEPVGQMAQALDEGASLIIFPEGTRNTSDETLLAFKSGLYHLAKSRPNVDLVPSWIDNLNRVMPKGEVIPLPLICTVTFGAPLRVAEDETKDDFLDRARSALLALSNESMADEQQGDE